MRPVKTGAYRADPILIVSGPAVFRIGRCLSRRGPLPGEPRRTGTEQSPAQGRQCFARSGPPWLRGRNEHAQIHGDHRHIQTHCFARTDCARWPGRAAADRRRPLDSLRHQLSGLGTRKKRSPAAEIGATTALARQMSEEKSPRTRKNPSRCLPDCAAAGSAFATIPESGCRDLGAAWMHLQTSTTAT